MAPLTQPFSRLGPFKITGVGQVITVVPAGQYAQPGQLGQIVLYNESSFVLGISDTSTGARLDLQPLTANVYDPPAAGGALLATVISGIATTTRQRLSGQVALGGMQIEGAWPQTLSSIGSVTLPSVTTTTLQNATVNSSYSATLNGTGGVAPYTWAVTSGSLPAGLSLSSGGVISGTPTTAGSASFTVTLTDTEGNTASAGLSLVVNPLVSPKGLLSAANTVPWAASISSVTIPLSGVQSGQPILVAVFQAAGSTGISGVLDTFATHYTWSIVVEADIADATNGIYGRCSLLVGAGGAGTAGDVIVDLSSAVTAGAIAVAGVALSTASTPYVAGSSASTQSGSFQLAGVTAASGDLGVAAATASWTSDYITRAITVPADLPSGQPLLELHVPLPAGVASSWYPYDGLLLLAPNLPSGSFAPGFLNVTAAVGLDTVETPDSCGASLLLLS